MSRRPTLLPRPATVAAALAVAVLLSGCGAGLDAELYREQPAYAGSEAVLGSMEVRDVYVVGPASRTTSAYLVLYNTGGHTDTLIGASTPLASAVTIVDGSARPTPVADLAIPPGGEVFLDTPSAHLALQGLTHPITIGEETSLTLDFQAFGELTIKVPISAAGGYDVPLPSGSPSASSGAPVDASSPASPASSSGG